MTHTPIFPISELLDELNEYTREDLVKELFTLRGDYRAVCQRHTESMNVLDETRDRVDGMRRRLDLCTAIFSVDDPNALTKDQLERIAEIVWPATVQRDPTQIPTQLPDPQLLQASALLWNAYWFCKEITRVSGLTTGQYLESQITRWVERCKLWREQTGVEKHESDEVKAMPQ